MKTRLFCASLFPVTLPWRFFCGPTRLLAMQW
jgi:hypothetical protein